MTDTIRVVVVDDILETREHLAKLLSFETDIDVVGVAASGPEAIEIASRLNPDVVLMDVSMPGLDGLEATYALKAQLPDVTVLMLSVGDKEQEIAAGLAGGAAEYLVKGGPAREIVDAIKRYGPVPGPA